MSGGNDGGLTKQAGAGTLSLTGKSTYTGATTVSAGTLKLDYTVGSTTGQLANSSSLVLNNGGSLLLAGSTSVTDRLNNAASVTINAGGTFGSGGLNEGTAPTGAGGNGGVVGLGALQFGSPTLTLRAVVDFGSTKTGSALVFSSLAASGKGAYVNILDWTGTAGSDNGVLTNDRLLFATDPGYSATDLAHWQFSNDSGAAFTTGGLEIAYNGYFEIVPVPEPSTWTLLLLGAGGLLFIVQRRKRRMAA